MRLCWLAPKTFPACNPNPPARISLRLELYLCPGAGRGAWGFSVAAWRKEAPDGGDFGYFGLVSRPRAHPASQHGPCAEVRKAAGLTFPRLHLGGFAPRAWRVSVGCLEKNRGFFGIAPARLVLF